MHALQSAGTSLRRLRSIPMFPVLHMGMLRSDMCPRPIESLIAAFALQDVKDHGMVLLRSQLTIISINIDRHMKRGKSSLIVADPLPRT
jgi:hypothetical protein